MLISHVTSCLAIQLLGCKSKIANFHFTQNPGAMLQTVGIFTETTEILTLPVWPVPHRWQKLSQKMGYINIGVSQFLQDASSHTISTKFSDTAGAVTHWCGIQQQSSSATSSWTRLQPHHSTCDPLQPAIAVDEAGSENTITMMKITVLIWSPFFRAKSDLKLSSHHSKNYWFFKFIILYVCVYMRACVCVNCSQITLNIQLKDTIKKNNNMFALYQRSNFSSQLS